MTPKVIVSAVSLIAENTCGVGQPGFRSLLGCGNLYGSILLESATPSPLRVILPSAPIIANVAWQSPRRDCRGPLGLAMTAHSTSSLRAAGEAIFVQGLPEEAVTRGRSCLRRFSIDRHGDVGRQHSYDGRGHQNANIDEPDFERRRISHITNPLQQAVAGN